MKPTTVIYLLRDPACRLPEELGKILRAEIARQLLALEGLLGLQIDVSDEHANVKTPSLRDPRKKAHIAFVKVKLDSLDAHRRVEALLRAAEFVPEGYLVEESPYVEYGENAHAGPRDWPDGERSPGIVAITCLPLPPRMAHEEWMRRWHGRMSPVSEAIQPRTRYMRNVVLRTLTEGAPELGGIVEEAYPSKEHVENLYLFFGANGRLELARNMFAIFRAVTSFVNLTKLRTTMMSEYFIRSEYGGSKALAGAKAND